MNFSVRLISLFIAVLSIASSVSCAKSSDGVYISVSSVSTAISSAVPLEGGYYSASDSYCKYYFKDDDGSAIVGNTVNTENWTVQKSKSQSSENEFGIFITDKKSVGEVKSVCEKYIEIRKNAYMDAKAAYSPEEYEKFRDAEVFVSGSCVIYFIMKKSDINIAKKSVSALLE